MKICYLSNQYPKVSHTFIRREILALEAIGGPVFRVSARVNAEGLVDPLDISELENTHSIAQGRIPQVLTASVLELVSSPFTFFKSLVKGLTLGVRDNIQLPRYLIYLAEACYLKQLCKKNGVDHIHAHFGTNPAAVAYLCRILGGPSYSFTVHGPEEFDRPLSLSLGEKIHGAAFVVAISFFCQSQLYRWCKNLDEWKKVTIVRCALDRGSFEDTKPISEGCRRFLAIGRLCEQKGFPLLLEAASRLNKQGVTFQLDIVGDGPMRGDIEAKISSEGLADCVKLLGYKSGGEVIDLLDQSCCLVVPSFAEGLPVVIMEALARRRPVLSTSIAAMSELLSNGVNGWVIPAGNVDALTQKMNEILELDVSVLNTFGATGQEKVRLQHNSVTEAKKLHLKFHAVLDQDA